MHRQEPFVYKEIANIDPNVDFRINIIGKIIEKKEDMLIVDDGTGNIIVNLSSDTVRPELKGNEMVRVFGIVLPTQPLQMQANIIQDFSNLNLEILKTWKKIYHDFKEEE